ncbi:hypothetical protein SAMN04488591_0692 [Microbacterium azadirachtae]|uniref:HNH endonuclease n=1 Tax=Microbacterium azadirachtae TaxID=582680 RepID=A0A1I6G342_9MICO|nr:hypothetical protein [Microbacterium azadirachtae]SFR36592.1 hypothetical protein SAMN04488591_0692 [Microbacterium azadirachtae]
MPSKGAKQYEMQAKHRARNFELMIQYLLAHPCVDCGINDPVVLEFDHLPEFAKRFEIARAITASTRSWATIAAEMAKCEVVCANCHRRRTAKRARTRKYLISEALSEPRSMGPDMLNDDPQ